MSTALPAQVAAQFWHDCDTVLLDMDGTLLDLSFDNWFWREAVPRCLARARGGPALEVRERLFEHFARKQGSLDWYCLDYWTRELGLDLRALKEASSHRIRYLPGAREFLQQAQRSGKRLVLVTNAHAETLEVKKGGLGPGAVLRALPELPCLRLAEGIRGVLAAAPGQARLRPGPHPVRRRQHAGAGCGAALRHCGRGRRQVARQSRAAAHGRAPSQRRRGGGLLEA
jgi:hypothetical protein